MRVRRATLEDSEKIFLMGYDSWGADLPTEMYLDSCLASYKYKQGQFFVLENDSGELLSSCIVYPLSAFGGIVAERAVGIGSLATTPTERHKGYATLFLSILIAQLEQEGVDAFFMYAENDSKIYPKLGFAPAPKSCRDKSDGYVPLLRLAGGKNVSPELWRELVMPEYF